MSAADPLPPMRAQSTAEPSDADHDGRSSSLSDIGDHDVNEEVETIPAANGGDVEANDTEAETERLEDTPLKRRKHQNVVLTSENRFYSSGASPSGAVVSDELVQHTSDISSLEDSSEGEDIHMSTTSPAKKRKLSSLEDGSLSSRQSHNADKSPSISTPSRSLTPKTTETTHEEVSRNEIAIESDPENTALTPSQKHKSKTGKRKGKKLASMENKPVDPAVGHAEHDDGLDTAETAYSNGEDAEIEDAGDPELDASSKNDEGLLKKKSALDSLTDLEKCFATLRDRLFDERLESANKELALLQQPGFVHPELLAMKEAADLRRNQKIEYQRKHLKYKLQSLQRESIATKHQALSQYMQTVREIRDGSLDQLNKELYQVQRERRSVEGDVPDYSYSFTMKRSQQITQQTAYNNEISILSGVARYVGFPAAPAIRTARPNELHEDMQNMGIVLQPPQILQTRTPPLRTNYAAAPTIPRHTPAVEEQFMEQHAWANPKHPAHQQQRQQMHRQISSLSQAPTPSSTPAVQKGPKGMTNPQESASTTAEPQSAPNSSIAPISRAGEQLVHPIHTVHTTHSNKMIDATLSRITGLLPAATSPITTVAESSTLQPRFTNPSKPDRNPSPSVMRIPPARDSHTPSALPKPLPFTQSAASRGSPPIRLPVKVEDVGPATRHSPVSHQFSSPVPAIAAGNGQRFGS